MSGEARPFHCHGDLQSEANNEIIQSDFIQIHKHYHRRAKDRMATGKIEDLTLVLLVANLAKTK